MKSNKGLGTHVLEDLTHLVKEIDALLHTAKDRADEEVGDATEFAQGMLSTAGDKLADLRERLGGVDRFVRDNPWTAIGAATIVAFLLGCLVEQRRD